MANDEQVKNRGYSRVDLPMVTGMGTASGYVAALVFMLYVDSSTVRAAYREPSLLWLVLPALLYWLGRIWLLGGPRTDARRSGEVRAERSQEPDLRRADRRDRGHRALHADWLVELLR